LAGSDPAGDKEEGESEEGDGARHKVAEIGCWLGDHAPRGEERLNGRRVVVGLNEAYPTFLKLLSEGYTKIEIRVDGGFASISAEVG